VFLNKGDGTFAAGAEYAAGSAPVEVRIGDLNGDDHADLVTANLFSDSVSVLLGRGDGSFGGDLEYPSGREPLSVAIGDLNGDGQPDLATANWGSRRVSVLLNATGLCAVPQLKGQTLATAIRELAAGGCSRGKVGRAYSKKVKKGRVVTQRPRYGAVLRNGAAVNFVLSRGARR
jgi:FG-GAP-like repeat/PASTA domain